MSEKLCSSGPGGVEFYGSAAIMVQAALDGARLEERERAAGIVRELFEWKLGSELEEAVASIIDRIRKGEPTSPSAVTKT